MTKDIGVQLAKREFLDMQDISSPLWEVIKDLIAVWTAPKLQLEIVTSTSLRVSTRGLGRSTVSSSLASGLAPKVTKKDLDAALKICEVLNKTWIHNPGCPDEKLAFIEGDTLGIRVCGNSRRR